MRCDICPRRCGVDRDFVLGVCGVPSKVKVAKAYLHQWEEPCISGENGSGTIFFSGCNLKCVYCQNWEISSECKGREITTYQLANIFKDLESKGATNINLVSPSHYVFAIKEALDIYRPNIPIVYNSNGYDSIEALDILRDYIDIFLVDFKYMDSLLAERLSHAKDYPTVVKSAIVKMKELQPVNIFKGENLQKGVIIRHLVLPNHTDDSINILKWIKDNVDNPCVSLMGQYVPMYKGLECEDISRKLKPLEYKIVEKTLISLGLTDGYVQDLDSASTEYTPNWDFEGIDE